MVDRAEDPEKMIKQVILDMENQYLQVKDTSGRVHRRPAHAGKKVGGER